MEDERVAEGPVIAVKRVMTVERRGPAACKDSDERKARVNDKATQQFAGPEEESIRQG